MIRSHALLLVTAALVATSFAQLTQFPNSQNTSTAAQPGDIRLTGTVVNSVTGEPIARALVQLSGRQPSAALTDGSGRFYFEGLSESQVFLTARKPGFFSDQELQRGGRPVFLQIVPGMHAVTVSLVPAGVITGHLSTPDGDPVEGALVRLKRRMIQNGRREWVDQNGARTDEDGAYRLGNLPPGVYYLFAEGMPMPRIASEETYAPAFYPGVPDITGASPLQVEPGQTLTADFTLQKEKAYRVTGIVTGLPPGESASIRVQGSGDESMPIGAMVQANDNSFEIPRIPAGTYTLKAMSQPVGGFMGFGGGGRPANRMPQRYTGSVPVTVSGDVTGVTIALQPSATIPISVRTEFTKQDNNDGGAYVSFGDSSRRVRQYVQITLHAPDNREVHVSQMDENGTMAMRDMEPGRYRAEFTAIGNVYVESATFGNVDLLHQDLVISSGGDQQPIDIVVRDDAASISGTANCGDTQCWVLVVPDGSTAIAPRQIMVSRLGTFQSISLAPGSYRVYAFDRLDGVEYTNPDAMKAYDSTADSVVLSAGQKSQVTLELTKAVDQ
jgi:hypothetical protein